MEKIVTQLLHRGLSASQLSSITSLPLCRWGVVSSVLADLVHALCRGSQCGEKCDAAAAWRLGCLPAEQHHISASLQISCPPFLLTWSIHCAEAANVEKIVTQLLRGGLSASQVGIITPYEGQRTHVVALLAKGGPLGAAAYAGIEVCMSPVVLFCSCGFQGLPENVRQHATRYQVVGCSSGHGHAKCSI